MSPFVLNKTNPYYVFENENVSRVFSDPSTLLFVTYNAGCGKKLDDIIHDINSSPRLRESGVIFLQEIEAHPGEEVAQAEKIARGCGFTGVYAPAREEKKRGKQGTHGLAILSKYPLADTAVFELPRYELGPKTRRRVCVTAKVMLSETDHVRVYNVHLDTRINAEDRVKQLTPVLNDALKYSNDKIVIAGDVNTINFDEWNPDKWLRKWLPQKFWVESQRIRLEAFVKEMGFDFPTFKKSDYTMNEWLQKMLLDAVFVRNLTIHSSGIEYDAKGSDHKPLWALVTH